MMIPLPYWPVHVALILLALVLRDRTMLRVAAVIFLDQRAGAWVFEQTGEQFNMLANFVIDWIAFSAVMIPEAVLTESKPIDWRRVLLPGRSERVIGCWQAWVGLIFSFIIACELIAAWQQRIGTFDWASSNRYWYRTYWATWAQVGVVGLWGLSDAVDRLGEHVSRIAASVRSYAGRAAHRRRLRRDRH